MWRTIAIYFSICFLFHNCECQTNFTATIDPYIGVNVTDGLPIVTDDVEKIYTTSLLLQRKLNGAVFVDSTFTNAAASVYGQLQGYNGIRDITSSAQGNDIKITYNVVYVYNTLNLTSSDEDVINIIGNLEAVREKLISETSTFISLFSVSEDPTTFEFTGNSLCSSVQCTQGAYISCSEIKNGTTIQCVSPCKVEYCKNSGICTQADVDTAPTCACPTQSDLWYLGRHCETLLTLWMVILIALAIFLLIVVVIVVMCVCYYRKKRRVNKLKMEKKKLAYSNKAYIEDNTKIIAITKAESEHRRNSENEHNRHYTHHRRRSSSRSQERRGSHNRTHRRTYTPDETTTPSKNASSTSEEYTSSDGEQNVADFEIDVSEIYNQGPDKRDTSTSPIRWLPVSESDVGEQVNPDVGVDIGSRPGWRPSLGPNMFDLKQSIENLNQLGRGSVSSEEPYHEITLPYGQGKFVGETDL